MNHVLFVVIRAESYLYVPFPIFVYGVIPVHRNIPMDREESHVHMLMGNRRKTTKGDDITIAKDFFM